MNSKKLLELGMRV